MDSLEHLGKRVAVKMAIGNSSEIRTNSVAAWQIVKCVTHYVNISGTVNPNPVARTERGPANVALGNKDIREAVGKRQLAVVNGIVLVHIRMSGVGTGGDHAGRKLGISIAVVNDRTGGNRRGDAHHAARLHGLKRFWDARTTALTH